MVRPTNFEITQHADGPVVTLRLQGELDMSTSPVLSEALTRHLEMGANDVTLDLRKLAFMDSSGLGLLIELHDRSRREAWGLKLLPPEAEAAALVIRSTGAEQALPFVPAADA
jgi:anti-sigma B factor antagonist